MADGSSQGATWHSAAELAGLVGLPGTERGVGKRAKREAWLARSRSGRGGGVEYNPYSLPPVTQAALLLRTRPTCTRSTKRARAEAAIASAWQRYDRVKQALKDTAAQRMKALHAVHALTHTGTALMDARDIVAAQLLADGMRGGSAANIARWQKAVAGANRTDWLALLVPHYTGRTSTARIPEELWDLFKADWLRVEQPSATSCYDRMLRVAAARGLKAPSLRTLQRRIEKELPRAVRVLARQGEEAFARTYPAQERDRGMFSALEGVNSDGHRWDFNVRFPDDSIGRPSILGWQDLYSGKMLSFRLCDNESSDVVRLSLADMVRDFGIPGHAWLDNGRAFASKWMTGGTPNRYRFKIREEDPIGVMTALGIEVHWVTPYHGQAKPIERAWRDFCDRIAKHPAFAGAYVGNNPTNKPENYGSRAIAWDVFTRVVGEEIAAHNARVGRRTKVCAGRSFDQAFNESYARTIVRKVTSEQLRMLFLAAEAVTASQVDGSVRLAGNRYWTEALAEHAGRKVVLRVDPQHLHGSVHVYALDGTYIDEAECVASVGFADTNAARDHARGKSQWRRANKQMLEAERRMDAAAVAAQLPSLPPDNTPVAAVIAPVFRNHGKQAAQSTSKDIEYAATGTDGVTALDKWLIRRSERLSEEEI